MALKIAINGFGRTGRCVSRIIDSRDDVEFRKYYFQHLQKIVIPELSQKFIF
jgi:hypothetical protein